MENASRRPPHPERVPGDRCPEYGSPFKADFRQISTVSQETVRRPVKHLWETARRRKYWPGGVQDEAKRGQDEAKRAPEAPRQAKVRGLCVFLRFFPIFGRVLDGPRRPRGSPRGPRSAQERPKTVQKEIREAPRSVRSAAQEAFKQNIEKTSVFSHKPLVSEVTA